MKQQLAYSNQKDVDFVFCPHPVTIDKSAEWGAGNIQQFPDGVFLKKNAEGIITHGVQPNEDSTAPVGWEIQPDGFYTKKPIWFLETLVAGKNISLDTLDGPINYEVKEASVLVAQDVDGQPNMKDTWVVSQEAFNRDYYFKS